MKALIPAAGYGTRFLPATKSVPKEMLPIGAKPVIQLIVEEALQAQVDEVVIITSPEKPALKRYFDPDPLWRMRCSKKPEIDAELAHLEMLSRHLVWVDQTQQKGLGHAVFQAADIFRGEKDPVLILLGDALVSGDSPSASMTHFVREKGTDVSVVGLEEVPLDRVSRYGIADLAVRDQPVETNTFARLKGLVEKPTPEKAPSRLAVAGRYLLSPVIFDLLAQQAPGAGGEIQLTDAIARLALCSEVWGYRYPGTRHDVGNPQGYLKALNAMIKE